MSARLPRMVGSASHEDRILAALRAGEMELPALEARLQSQHVDDALYRLQARGLVVCVQPRRGNIPSVWARVDRLEQSA